MLDLDMSQNDVQYVHSLTVEGGFHMQLQNGESFSAKLKSI